MNRPKLVLTGAVLLVALGCGGGSGSGPSGPPASSLAYTPPTDLTGWRLVQDSASSTGTHLVLDLLAPSGLSGQGVTLTLTGDASRATCSLLAGGAYANPLVRIASPSGSALRTVVAQAPGSPIVYGANPVLSFALDLTANATTGTITLTVTQAGHLDAFNMTAPITVQAGTVQVN